MNKLKGAMRIYAGEDLMIFIVLIVMLSGFSVALLSGVGDPVNLEEIPYFEIFTTSSIMMIIVMTWVDTILLNKKFLMQANFNSSRKLFYKANLIVIFTISFSLVVLIYSVTFILGFIGIFKTVFMSIHTIAGAFITYFLLNFAMKSFNNYIFIMGISLSLSLINFLLSWQIIKRKLSLVDARFIKMEMSMGRFSK